MNSDGTKEFISRVVEQYSSMLLHLAASRVDAAADAEDVVQSVFLKLLTSAPAFHDTEHEKAWLIRATVNAACDLRRRASRRDVPLDDAVSPVSPQEPSALLSAVRSLPDKYSTVIHLHYYEGYSIKELSNLLGLPAPTVGTRLARGREQLRRLLKEDFE